MKIFLSYTSSKDKFMKVTSFRERLESEVNIRSPGSRVFQDTQHLKDGEHFPESIDKELKSSDLLLALVSPAWLESEWCRREFTLFTSDATDTVNLHRILPVLWVDTPQMSTRSMDLIARTIAAINYSDWRDLRYESWDDPRNQRQLGKLAGSALALCTPSSPPLDQTPRKRLDGDREQILIALADASDGLPEDSVAQAAGLSGTRAAVYLNDLQESGYVRRRLRVGQRVNHWLISAPGQAYLVLHNIAA